MDLRKIIFTLLAVALLASSCKEQRQEASRQAYPVITVQKSAVEVTNDYPATIRGRQDIEIYPQVSGKIVKVAVTEGQRVSRGQTLFVIDQVAYRAALQNAEANVRAARAAAATARQTYVGKRELFEQKVVSEFELNTAHNAMLTAEAQLAQATALEVSARNDLSYTVVTSPANGVVGTIPYRVGALVSSSSASPLTTVSDNSEMYVYFSIPENSMLALIRKYGSVDKTIKQMPAVQLRLTTARSTASRGAWRASAE